MTKYLNWVLALLATAAFAQRNPKIAIELENFDASSMADVIVQYAHPPAARHHEKVRALGGVLREELGVIQAGHYSIPVAPFEVWQRMPM
jgi:hypothetical protein